MYNMCLPKHQHKVAQWLDEGTHIYVCGATTMAKDVHDVLIDIIQRHKNISRDDATDELNSYTAIGRYQRDIYINYTL